MSTNPTLGQDIALILAVDASISRLPTNQQAAIVQRALRKLPSSAERNAVIIEVLRDMSPDEQAATLQAAWAVIAQPAVGVRNWLWPIVIAACAIVLVSVFSTLAISIFGDSLVGSRSG